MPLCMHLHAGSCAIGVIMGEGGGRARVVTGAGSADWGLQSANRPFFLIREALCPKQPLPAAPTEHFGETAEFILCLHVDCCTP